MRTQTVAELRSERLNIVNRMGDLLTRGTPEALAERALLDPKQEALRVEIDRRNVDIEAASRSRGVPATNPPGIDNGRAEEGRELASWEREAASPEYDKVFRNWTKGGNAPNSLVSLRGASPMVISRALGDSNATGGETLVPTGFQRELEVKMKYYSGMRQVCRILQTPTGNPMPWPTMDDTSNVGEVLTEGSGGTSADPTFNNVTLSSYLVSSKQVKVSVQLEQDAFTDVTSILSDAFAVRIGRLLNTLYTKGDGTSGIYGLLANYNAGNPSATGIVGNGNSVLAVGANANSGNSGDTDLTSVGSSDLSNLIEALDYSYVRPTSKFMFHQSTLNFLRRVQDKYGRPLFNATLASDVPETIYGHGYIVNNDIAPIGAGNISVVFGDFDKYILRDSLGITLVRFNELYMTNYQRGYQAFGRYDGKLLQPAAFSYLIHPLS